MIGRMVRVIRLDRSVYDEVEHDPAGTTQAAIVVAIVAIASAIGVALQAVTGTAPKGSNLTGAILGAILTPFIHWIIWSYLTSFIGTFLFRAQTTPRNMLPAQGYAQAPQVLTILGFIPIVGAVLVVIGRLLALRAGFVAAQTILGLNTPKTLVTILVSFGCAFLIASVTRALLANIGFLSSLVSP